MQHRNSSIQTRLFRNQSPVEPPFGTGDDYRPEMPELDHPNRSSSGLPWGGSEILGAIGLSITVSAVVLFAGALADALQPGSDESAPGYLATAIVAAALTFVITRVTKLPFASAVNLFGLATLANVAVHALSEGGETDLLGLPPSFIEAAILSGVPFGVTWLYVSRKHHRSIRDLGFVSPKSGTAYLLAAGVWFLALIGVGLWGQLVTDIETISPPDNATPVLEIAGGSLLVAWLLVGLWGPAVEEIFFRGFLLGGLHRKFGFWPALLISSGIFSLFHVHLGLYVPTFLLGLAFGWVYLKTRSIWPSIFAHTLHNSLVIIAVWQDLG